MEMLTHFFFLVSMQLCACVYLFVCFRWDTIMDLLDLIEKDQVLSAAQVLNILALNPRLPLRVVSQYIASSFRVSFSRLVSCSRKKRVSVDC